MRVSVVVPAYNEEPLLPLCLAALRAQDYDGPFEIIVVDNGSTDATAEIARAGGATVVHEPHRDYCRALIRGFAAARGAIIAMTDADTVVPPDWLSRLVEHYRLHPEVVAVGGDVVFDRPNVRGFLLARVLVPAFNWLDRRNPRGAHLWGANLSVRRDAFERVGGWNPAYSLEVDSELSERLRSVGRVVVLESLRVRTSSRRWNRSLLPNLFLYVSNFVWMKCFARPLWRDFPVVRETTARRPRRLRFAFAAGFTLALAGLGFGAFWPRSSAFGRTYWHVDTHEKVVALTFDDGPNEPYTSRTLDILSREHVRATFFLVGENVRHFPAAAARIAREGHVIGNHSDHHPLRFALLPEADQAREIAAAEQTIYAATGRLPKYFRPPQGLRSPWLMQILDRDSLIAVTWDDAPGDWDPMPSTTVAARTIQQAHPGSIILLHDGMNLTHGADQSEMVDALPAIIAGLRARGYRFVTLPELLRAPATLTAWHPAAGRHHA